MRKKYFLTICVTVIVGLLGLGTADAQTPPAAAPATTPVPPPKPAATTPAATAAPAKPATTVSGDATKAKALPKGPVELKPEHVSELQEKSKSKYNIWFSDTVKTNYNNFPYKKSFLAWPRIYEINRAAIPICKQQFKDLCGTEDYPVAEKFIFCLQQNFEKLKGNQNCAVLGHYLIYMNFNRYLASTTEPCKAKYDACLNSADKTLPPAQCVLAQPDLSPMCLKLMADSLKLRGYASRVYDAKFACTSPESCK